MMQVVWVSLVCAFSVQEGTAPWEQALRKKPQALAVAQKTFRAAWIMANMAESVEAPVDGNVLVAPKGLALQAHVQREFFELSADPGFLVRVPWRPDVRMRRIQYDFGKARFDVDVEAVSFDFFDIVKNTAKRTIEEMLERDLKPHLPERMQRPGYSLQSDPDLLRTLVGLRKALSETVKVTPPLCLGRVSNVTAGVVVAVPAKVEADGENQTRITLFPSTFIQVSVGTRGPLSSPRLNSLGVNIGEPGVLFQSIGDLYDRLTQRMTLYGVTATKSGFVYSYELAAEKAIDDIQALWALLILASGNIPPVPERARLDRARREVDAQLTRQARPWLYEASTVLARRTFGPKAGVWLRQELNGWGWKPNEGVRRKLNGLLPRD